MGLSQQKFARLHTSLLRISPYQVPTQTHFKNQDALHLWHQPMYGAKTRDYNTGTAELLDAQSTLYVQKVCGDFLYYAIAIDQTMLVVLNTIT